MERRLVEKPDNGWDAKEQLRATAEKVKRGISRLIDSYQDGLLEKSDFEPRIRRTKERLTSLKSELEQWASEEEQRETMRLVTGRMREFAEKVTDGLDRADWATPRAIIRAVVKWLEIDEAD